MKHRILYLIDRLHTGGTEGQLIALIKGLDRERFEPHVGVFNLPGGCHFDTLDIPKLSLDFRSFCRPSLLQSVQRLVSYIRRQRIQLVQTFFQDPFLLAALSKPFHRALLIGSFRDMGFWRNRREILKMRLAYPAFHGFIANSRAVRDEFVAADSLDSEKFAVIYNGIDLAAISPRPVEPPSPPVVGIVANLNRPVKRVQDFVAVADLAHRQRPDVRFCVVGGGYLQPELEQQAKALGLGQAITFTGLVDEPLKYVANWTVGVITSETEGFCNGILEYMACGLPVVATSAGGNPELVKEGDNGFLVPVGMPEVLAQRILTLLDSANLAADMGRRNIATIRNCFSLQAMVDRYQQQYSCWLAGMIGDL
jgi:L-malate glycosyltransferase